MKLRWKKEEEEGGQERNGHNIFTNDKRINAIRIYIYIRKY